MEQEKKCDCGCGCDGKNKEIDVAASEEKLTGIDKGRKWTIKDIILTVILSIISVGILAIMNFATMPNDVLNLIFCMGLVFLMISPLYMFLARKVNKPGVMAGFFFIFLIYTAFSYWYVSLMYFVVLVLIELFMWKKNSYKTTWKATLVYAVMAVVSLLSSYASIMQWDSFVTMALNSGMTQEYIDTFRAWYTNVGIGIGIAAFTMAMAVGGCIASHFAMKKYFKKSGIL